MKIEAEFKITLCKSFSFIILSALWYWPQQYKQSINVYKSLIESFKMKLSFSFIHAIGKDLQLETR